MRIETIFNFKYITHMPVSELVESLCDKGIELGNYYYIIKGREQTKSRILLTSKSNNFLHYNSFLPDIVMVSETDQDNLLDIKLKINKSVKITYFLISFVCLIFQLILIGGCVFGNIYFSIPVLIPLAILVLGYAIMNVGFYLCARNIKRELLDALATC